RTIADRRGLNPKSIMREINYALTATQDVYVKLSELTGLTFADTDMRASLVIAYLARLLSVPELILK
ncbi:MAG: hypothetical protein K2L54_05855, partial [Clostridiales bacterium]|nr:hypothetical protein [Clostridiales bacterium]